MKTAVVSRDNWGQLRTVAMILAAPALLMAESASAQSMYQYRFEDITYQPLPSNARNLSYSGDEGYGAIGMDFPVEFFGQQFPDLKVSTNGWISPDLSGTGYWSNVKLPGSGAPAGMIAAWWDDHTCNSNGIRTMTFGQAPDRWQIVEWDGCRTLSGSHNWKAQVWFFEGQTRIEVHYGPADASTSGASATVGLESPAQTVEDTVEPLTCDPNCRMSDFPQGKKIVYATFPNLVVASAETPAVAYAGQNTRLAATVVNMGWDPAEGVDVAFWVSTDPVLEDTDWYLGTTDEGISLERDAAGRLAIEALLPRELEPGTYYLIAQADPDGKVDELDENDNLLAVGSLVIGPPTPDLTVGAIAFPETVEPGVPFDLVWSARNLGNLGVEDAAYSVVISTDDVLSPSDLPIAQATFSVGEFADQEETIQVTVPADLKPGTYWLGMVIDPENEIHEANELNNGALASEPFLLASSTVEILTTTFPPTTQGAPYCRGLQATGGDGTYAWTVVSGALPPGIELDELHVGERVGATRLCGEAAALGSFSFTLQVESNGASDSRSFEVVVQESITDIVIVTDRLAPAMVMESYPQALSAVGGVAPYEWHVIEGTLPVGIGLEKGGRFFGRAKEEGHFSFTVEVKDREGQTARQGYELVVDPSQAVRCLTETLPTHKLGQEFNVRLRASGGNPPYRWSTLESRRLPTSLDDGQALVGQAPAGLHLANDGTIAGAPQAVGSYYWQVEVGSQDSTQTARCSITFDVTYDEGLVITTRTLQEAYAGERYEAELRVVGGEPPLTWSLLPGSQLPDGFELASDGTLSGAFDRNALAGAKSTETTFSVRVHDFHNRAATAAFRLGLLAERPTWEVVIDEPRTESNCQVAGGAPGLFSWLAVLGLAALHRRRRG